MITPIARMGLANQARDLAEEARELTERIAQYARKLDGLLPLSHENAVRATSLVRRGSSALDLVAALLVSESTPLDGGTK